MSTIRNPHSWPCADRLNGDQLLTMDEAASRIGVTFRMVRRLTSGRRLAFAKIGEHVRIPASAVEECIAAGYMPATARVSSHG